MTSLKHMWHANADTAALAAKIAKPRRRLITRDMLVTAKANGWNVRQAAQELGFCRSAMTAACIRFRISLSAYAPDPCELPAPTKQRLSASPAAIRRAADKLGVRL